MSKEKRQLMMSLIMLVLSILLLVGTTFAYFSDKKQMTNTLTVGNVKIEMTEAAVKRDDHGNLVENPAEDRVVGGDDTVHDYGVVYPGIEIYKDPTIRNIGTEGAWIAARIVVSDGVGNLENVLGFGGGAGIDIAVLLSGGLFDEGSHFGVWNGIRGVRYNDRYAMVQTVDSVTGDYVFHIFLNQSMLPDEQVVLFDRFAVPEDWSSEDMKELIDLKLRVEAYGVQTFDLTSCFEAMTKAFPEQFSFNI